METILVFAYVYAYSKEDLFIICQRKCMWIALILLDFSFFFLFLVLVRTPITWQVDTHSF